MPKTTQELPPELTFHFISRMVTGLYIRMALGAEFPLAGFLRFHFLANEVLSPKPSFDLFLMTAKHTGRKKIGVRKENLVREVECTIMMDERAARSLKQWLDDKIGIFDQIKAPSEEGEYDFRYT